MTEIVQKHFNNPLGVATQGHPADRRYVRLLMGGGAVSDTSLEN